MINLSIVEGRPVSVKSPSKVENIEISVQAIPVISGKRHVTGINSPSDLYELRYNFVTLKVSLTPQEFRPKNLWAEQLPKIKASASVRYKLIVQSGR